jgi:hypothetical protein
MAWQTPKTDWTSADGVRDTDFNRIEENILTLYKEVGLRGALMIYVNAISGNDITGNGTTSAPYKTITKAIQTLPKSLSGYNAFISIAAGTYNENVVIDGFAGKLMLGGVSNATVEITSLTVSACVVIASNIHLKATSSGTPITITNGATVLYTSGNLSAINTAMGTVGVSVTSMSRLYVANTLTVTGMGGGTALNCNQGSVVHVNTLDGYNKANGIEAANGGRVSYVLNSIIVSGVALATYTGGRIYTAAQTSVPNY